MSFLANAGVVGIEPVQSDFFVANGVYPAVVTGSKIDNFNGKTKWQITYMILQDVETYGGKTVSEWFDLDPNLPDNRKQFLVRRLANLAITQEDQATLEPQDILGIEVTITVKNRPSPDGTRSFTNVTNVKLDSHGGTSGGINIDAF